MGELRVQERLPPQRVLDRVLDGVVMGAKGCIISTRQSTEGGYTRLGWGEGGKIYRVQTHRAAWIAEHGPIPTGLTVHHRCFTLRCVNVRHLELRTNVDNARRQGAVRDVPEDGSCARGHGPEFWVVVSRNKKSGTPSYGCIECKRAAYRRWYAKNPGARTAYNRAYYQRRKATKGVGL